MNQRAELMGKIQRAGSLQEQAALVAELDAFDRNGVSAVAASRSLDLTATLVEHTLGAATAHERSTSATDWLGEISVTADDKASQKITAEAAMWYRRLSEEVRGDDEEFAEQQFGMARRTASAYGEQAPALAQEFVQYTSFLRAREGASGLPQVQQEVDSFENPAPTPLPQEVFDNFAPAVHPINEGVSGTETSERAPLLQEIEQEGGGGQGAPTHHDTAPQPYTYAEVPPSEPGQMQAAAVYDGPTVAINHTMSLDDYQREASRREAASGLPQVEQVVDSFENPAPTPLPTDVAYPWIITQDEGDQAQAEDKSQQSGSSHSAALDPAAVQRRAAYVAGLAMLDPADLTPIERQEIVAFTASLQKRADQWTQGGEQYKGPSAQNNPGTTPEADQGTFQEGVAEGRSDRVNDEAPTFADASPSIPEFAQGHALGYQEEAQAEVHQGQMPPGAGGMGTGYQTHAASLSVEAGNTLTCDNCGKTDTRGNMTQRGNGHTVSTLCTTCKPGPKTEADARFQGMRVSASFTAPVDQADPAFAKAYKYASKWVPGKRLVTTGSVAFEAGLYAGISDNPEHQEAWTAEHRKVAKAYTKPEMLQRLSKHRSFTKKAALGLPDLRVVGDYLQTRIAAGDPRILIGKCAVCAKTDGLYFFEASGHRSCPEHAPQVLEMSKAAVAKTAATSTDLDTMLPSASPSPAGTTPINGPGTPPILQGGTDPAAAGGPSPYNGAPPYGAPVVPSAASQHGVPTAIDDTPGGPIDQAARQHLGPAALAFRRTVQANLVQQQNREDA